jgi:hypothetical protein
LNKDLEDIPRKTIVTSFLETLNVNARTERPLEPKHPRKQTAKKSPIKLQVTRRKTPTKKWIQVVPATQKQMANK